MANFIESIDLQRAIRSAAYKKAIQLYGGKNLARGWGNKPTTPQIRGVFRLGYMLLKKKHQKTKWLQDKYKPSWISRLDYCAARGGKPMMQELLDIIENLGGIPMNQPVVKVKRLPIIMPPEPPLPDEAPDYLPPPKQYQALPQKQTTENIDSINKVFDEAIRMMNDNSEKENI